MGGISAEWGNSVTVNEKKPEGCNGQNKHIDKKIKLYFYYQLDKCLFAMVLLVSLLDVLVLFLRGIILIQDLVD